MTTRTISPEVAARRAAMSAFTEAERAVQKAAAAVGRAQKKKGELEIQLSLAKTDWENTKLAVQRAEADLAEARQAVAEVVGLGPTSIFAKNGDTPED